MSDCSENDRKNKGPKPDRVKIEGDWEEAMGKAMKKPRPKDGWPDQPKEKKKGD